MLYHRDAARARAHGDGLQEGRHRHHPVRTDLIECLDAAGIKHTTIEALQEKAYSLVGEPDELAWEDQVVAVLEARDGTILDVVRKIKPLAL